MTKRDKVVRDILWQVAAVLSKPDIPKIGIFPDDRSRALKKLYLLLDKLEDLK